MIQPCRETSLLEVYGNSTNCASKCSIHCPKVLAKELLFATTVNADHRVVNYG